MKPDSDNIYEKIHFSDLSEIGALEKVEFFSCTFNDCDLSDVKFTEVLFDKCTFDSVNLSNAKLLSSRFENCTFKNCRIMGVDWSTLRKEFGTTIICTGCDLSYSTFVELDMSKSQFRKCKILESEFLNCNLSECSFEESDLKKTLFNKNNLTGSDFKGAVSYYFDVTSNKCKGVICDYPEVLNLLTAHGISIEI